MLHITLESYKATNIIDVCDYLNVFHVVLHNAAVSGSQTSMLTSISKAANFALVHTYMCTYIHELTTQSSQAQLESEAWAVTRW